MPTALELRSAQTMRAAQAAYDAQLPEDCEEADDFDEPAPDRDDAEARVMQCGYELAWELGERVHAAKDISVSDVAALCQGGYDTAGKPLHELLAVVINAHDEKDVMAARYELRERLREALAPRIDEVLAEMQGEHLERVRFEMGVA